MTRLLSPLIFGLGFALPPLYAQESGTQTSATSEAKNRPAVIVIRHAEDATWVRKEQQRTDESPYKWPSDSWRKQTGETATQQSTWPNYNRPFILIKPDGSRGGFTETMTVSAHGLSGNWKTPNSDGTDKSPYGEDQAISLGLHLDQFIQQAGLAPISRAITMDPGNSAATANPFDTLWPYFKEKPAAEFYLIEYQAGKTDRFDGLMNLIKENKLLTDDGGGSAIICWTGEGMSEEKGVIGQLLKKYRGKTYEPWINKGNMRRCTDIFVFYGPTDGSGTAEWWTFDYDADPAKNEPAFTLKERHPEPAKF